MRGLALAWPLAFVLWATDARADTPPSVWDAAKDPRTRDRWALHVRVERLMDAPMVGSPDRAERRRDSDLRMASALALLEEADAEHSPDATLRFDLGNVYENIATIEQRPDLHSKAVAILAPAVDAFPDHPGVTEALESLTSAYSWLNLSREELATSRRYIARIKDDRARVVPLLNMGEADMRLGRLGEALATLREGLRLCGTLPNTSAVNNDYALLLWDVAVVLDRSGDPQAAAETAAKARGWSWTEVVGSGSIQIAQTVTGWDAIRDDTEVFFVPEWERDWYLALGDSTAAARAADPRDAAHLWAEAERHWSVYVAGSMAAGGTDRWLLLARARLDRARLALAAAAARAQKLPPRERTNEGGPSQ